MTEQAGNRHRDVRPGKLPEFWQAFSENRGAVHAACCLAVLAVLAVSAGIGELTRGTDLDVSHVDFERTPPFFVSKDCDLSALFPEPGGSESRHCFLLGTDEAGRDMLIRLWRGSAYSILLAVVALSFAAVGGTLVGLSAGFAPRWLDPFLTKPMDTLLALPTILVALVLASVLGPSATNAAIAIAIALMPHFARLTRASVLEEREKGYVTAAKVAGAGKARLMFLTVLPNCLSPLIVQTPFALSAALLDVAALGFLGLGVQRPTPEWGFMLANSHESSGEWWMIWFPGMAITFTVICVNVIGDGVRDALDPRLRRS